MYFVHTGNHTAFAFNLSSTTPYTIAILNSPGIFSLSSAKSPNPPYRTFTNGIDCPGCGPGASHAFSGPLDFSVTDNSGISISDFLANSHGDYFSADVLGPGGQTGSIAAMSFTDPPDPTPVPEPSSLLLLGSALVGIALVQRKKWGAITIPAGGELQPQSSQHAQMGLAAAGQVVIQGCCPVV